MTIDTVGACDGRRDLARAVSELAERLPEPLLPLARVAYNYQWSWMRGADALFRDIDPGIWRRSECNPRQVIEEAAPHRLREVAGQQEYIERLRNVATHLDAELTRPW